MSELRDIEVDEISLVDEPANQGNRILLFKRDSSSALDRAKAALEGVYKALGAAKPSRAGGWTAQVAALETPQACDRCLAELTAAESMRTGRTRAEVYSALLRTKLGTAIYERRQQLARAA